MFTCRRISVRLYISIDRGTTLFWNADGMKERFKINFIASSLLLRPSEQLQLGKLLDYYDRACDRSCVTTIIANARCILMHLDATKFSPLHV